MHAVFWLIVRAFPSGMALDSVSCYMYFKKRVSFFKLMQSSNIIYAGWQIDMYS